MALDWHAVLEAQLLAQKDVVAQIGHIADLFVAFSPVVGKLELPVQQLQGFVQNHTVADVPLLIGTNREETLLFVHDAFSEPLSRVEETAVQALIFGGDDARQINKQYPRDEASKAAGDYRNHTTNFTTDSLFHCPVRHAALMQTRMREQWGTRTSATYGYHFDQVISFDAAFWVPSSPFCVGHVCHGEELPYVFNINLTASAQVRKYNSSFTPAEVTLAHSMQTYWANFAKTGAPGSFTPPGGAPLAWPVLTVAQEQLMNLTALEGGNHVDSASYREKCAFWDVLGYEWVLDP